MLNSYGLLAALILLGGISSWAAIETGRADIWKGKFDLLQASYSQAATNAKADAAKQEAADLASIQKQSQLAISQAQSKESEAQTKLAEYLKKGKEASKGDLAHQCFDLPVPAEDIP